MVTDVKPKPRAKPKATPADVQAAVTPTESAVSAQADVVLPDGYNLTAEQARLSHLLDADTPDHNDPLYPDYELFLSKQHELAQLQAEHRARLSANPEVPLDQARKANQMGKLQSQEEDRMTVHTMEAMRLYLGASPKPGSAGRYPVPGGRRAATSLRQLFVLTAQNNPYADWALCECDQKLGQLKKTMAGLERHHVKLLDDIRAKGLDYKVLAAATPQSVSLGYHSPYGYAMSMLIVEFDYLVRVVKSAERRDLVSKAEAHAVFLRVKRDCRSLFESVIAASRILLSEPLQGLCRSDYLPQASDTSRQRVAAVQHILGVVPQSVFAGDLTPRHSLRNERLSGKDLEVLRQLAASMHAEPETETEQTPPTSDGLVD